RDWRSGFSKTSRASGVAASHPEHAEARCLDRRIEGCGDAKTQHHAGLGRIDDAVIPNPRARIIGMRLALESLADRRLEELFFLRRPGFSFCFQIVPAYLRQDIGGLFAAHHRNAGVRPHEEEARPEGTPTHAVIARPETA